ncbi:MAG: pyridoxamine 5'-phosphate oxidase family protein [Phycisphaerales bacterium]|jgi:hypothetical protein|nr:pyridoxamine 5'-phosphate oxidase family protein [Phycisphaerales bacterium]
MSHDTTISDAHRTLIEAQEMFFVATAPLAADGHVNVSPKGLRGTFAIIDDQTVAYLDCWGSGIETTAHLRENARLCIMFCSFDEKPKLLRLHGRGEVIEPDHDDFAALRSHFPDLPGTRGIIRLHIARVSTSCGFGVPKYAFQGHREDLPHHAREWGEDKVRAFTREHNSESIDGLAGTRYWTQ